MAAATVDPKTGGVSGITITEPGSGYATPPVVTISSPGITPTSLASAHATISPGVVTSIDVAEAGFGFTAPTVADHRRRHPEHPGGRPGERRR